MEPKFQSNKLSRTLASCLLVAVFGALAGWATTQGLLIKSLFIGMAALLALPLFSQNRPITIVSLQKGLLYLVIIAGFIGPALLAIGVGPIHLFPYRILLLVLWMVFAISVLFNHGRVSVSHMKVKSYLQFLALWLIYAVLSLAWAMSKADAIRQFIFLFMAASIIFFVIYYFSNGKDLKRFYYLWLGVFGGLLLLGIWEHFAGQHLPVSGSYAETRARFMFLPTAVFLNTNDYATFLALSIPFALGVLRYARNRLVRFIGLGAAAAAFYLIIVAGSRGNMLAVLLEVAFLMLFLTNLRQRAKVAVAATVCLAMAVFLLPGPVQELSSEVTGELSSISTQAELGTGSVPVRANLVRNGLFFLASTAGFGVGAGNAEYWMANSAIFETRGVLNPHNWWLEILINYGIFVFVGYILFYLGLVLTMWRVHRRTKNRGEKMICEALLVALVGFFLASVSSSSIMAFKPQWLLFAFALAFLNYQRRGRLEGVA